MGQALRDAAAEGALHLSISVRDPVRHPSVNSRLNSSTEHRTQLKAVAYRMLGSLSEADDAVQEAWLHLSIKP